MLCNLRLHILQIKLKALHISGNFQTLLIYLQVSDALNRRHTLYPNIKLVQCILKEKLHILFPFMSILISLKSMLQFLPQFLDILSLMLILMLHFHFNHSLQFKFILLFIWMFILLVLM